VLRRPKFVIDWDVSPKPIAARKIAESGSVPKVSLVPKLDARENPLASEPANVKLDDEGSGVGERACWPSIENSTGVVGIEIG
jgi:hypothetical protein